MAVVTCKYCQKQVIDGHDCPEKRRALVAEAQALGELPTVAEILWPPAANTQPDEASDDRAD